MLDALIEAITVDGGAHDDDEKFWAFYCKRFGKTLLDTVISIEERVRRDREKKEARRAARQQRSTNIQHGGSLIGPRTFTAGSTLCACWAHS